MKEKLEDIVRNLKSVAKKDDVNVKITTDEIVHDLYTIDIAIAKVKIDTVEKLIRVAYKYKECKTHEYNASKLRLIFGSITKHGKNIIGDISEKLQSFKDFQSGENKIVS